MKGNGGSAHVILRGTSEPHDCMFAKACLQETQIHQNTKIILMLDDILWSNSPKAFLERIILEPVCLDLSYETYFLFLTYVC